MNEKDAIEIIIRAFEDARGSILFRDEIQAVNCLEDYVQNSISKDELRKIMASNTELSAYHKIKKLLEEKQMEELKEIRKVTKEEIEEAIKRCKLYRTRR